MTCTIEGNNSVGSLLESLLKKVTPIVGSRMLWLGWWRILKGFGIGDQQQAVKSLSDKRGGGEWKSREWKITDMNYSFYYKSNFKETRKHRHAATSGMVGEVLYVC
jgi:hypothetical protein